MIRDLLHDLQTWRFWRRFAAATFAGLGLLAALLGVWDVFFPGEIARNLGPTLLFVLPIALVSGAIKAWPRPIRAEYSTPNTAIRVIRGDLLAQPGHLVIGTCDTFDTQVPDIIARSSLQGQYLERVLDNNIGRLDEQIELALKDVSPVQTVNKPGKTSRYPIGTVAVIPDNSRKTFLVAYTEMSDENVATATPDHVWRSLTNLWREVSRHANGQTVFMPVIGGGQSRLSHVFPAQDSIRFIALSFMFASRGGRMCEELIIVVPDEQYRKLDRLQLQSFLASLRPS